MDVVSMCPLRVGGFVWQSRTGAHALTVMVKATYLLQPGACVLAPDQEALNDADTHWNDDLSRSVHVPSDRAPVKMRADVVLVGHAYAPGGQPVRSLMTRMVVGSIDKSIEVWCDRGYRVHDRQWLEGQRFVKMPLRWERAARGPETNNPVGMRFDAAPDMYGMVAIPNLQPPGMFVSRAGETFAPVGYGPIGASWPGRRGKLGRYAGSFEGSRWEERPLPEDLHFGYFNVAPPDQQVEELRADERIVLENLHPEHARLVTSLPGMRPRAVVDRASGEREEVALRADMLWIDTDRGRCTLVWRGCVGLREPREAGRVAVWVDGEPALAVGGAGEVSAEELGAATMTLTAPVAGVGAALPFVPGESKLADPEAWGAAAEVAARWAAIGPSDGTETVFAPAGGGGDALPFRGGGGGATGAEERDDGEETLVPPPKVREAAAPPLVRLVPSALSGEGPVLQPLPAAREESRASEEPRESVAPAPPPMIGPLAKPEVVQIRESAVADAGVVESGQAQVEAPVEVEPDGPAPLPLEQYPLERCAAIAASIDRRKGERGRILEGEGLSGEVWEALHAHWGAAVEAEVDRGRKKMLSAYDEAYVGRLERERGPITAREYAGLLMAAERRGGEAELRRLGLPEGAMMRIRRVWLGRSVKDPKAGAEVRAEMRAGGEG